MSSPNKFGLRLKKIYSLILSQVYMQDESRARVRHPRDPDLLVELFLNLSFFTYPWSSVHTVKSP